MLGSKVLEIEGILNGITNFILEEMKNNKITYEEALRNAQKLKIAESDPSLDGDGFDTAIKILILAKVVMGIGLSLDDIYIKGIRNITLDEILESSSNDRELKLIGSVVLNDKDILVEVKPKIIDRKHPLYQIDGKSKGVHYKTDILGDITIIGGESSTLNASAAILRDLMSIVN